jgi:hypothetical protein
MTDYRALCARMADELDRYRQLLMNDRRATHALATEARAALAQPEPQGATGRPAIKPVPVAERLPGPEDCDAEGRCWVGINLGSCGHRSWILDLIADNDSGCWLPHHALPVPQQEAE